MIYVTKSFLPPFEAYSKYLEKIWDKNILTNRGPLTLELESILAKRFTLENFLFVSNGTIALQLVVKLFDLKGEVITTPFSYVATTSSLIWEGLTPVFADINPEDFCIDPDKIESLITEKTSAILATHVFGNPCDVQAIEKIAQKYNLKVIYDAAHAFDVSFDGKSILSYGDASTLSFHATKIFHTGEGGGVTIKDSSLFENLKLLHSFGHRGDEHFVCGINGKNSELHAAMGLTNLPFMNEIIASRKEITEHYISSLTFKKIYFQSIRNGASKNYSYFPVVFESEAQLLKVVKSLNELNIFPRRYFYPSLNTLPYVCRNNCPISEDIATRILCLPLYAGLENEAVARISKIINDVVN